ncbi:MerR family transcriptional regulator [Bacillus sp. EB600]|uniref:MerR family transcriptional regulator n=1 Tax=Bacillus sp. EB600 TaxID=2806345 RepID=UPI00210D64D0|nr:MerR family transcriptional regulator [Bacillus sp. EB600]
MRWYNGAVYRIGELADMALVSKRTIDYYTSIGLLKAERSKANYRIYTDDSLKDLKFIEECKRLHYPLEEIKRKLELKKAKKIRDSEVEEQISVVTQQMKQLYNDLSVLLPLIQALDEQQKEKCSNTLTLQGTALMKSLLNLTS